MTISIPSKTEVIRPTTPPQAGRAIRLHVPYSLTDRRIYLYLEVNQSAAAAYILEAAVKCYYKGSPVIPHLDASIADFTGLTPNSGVGSFFNAGGSPVGDCYVHRLAQPFIAANTSVVLQPLRINAEVDTIDLDFLGVFGTTLTGWRAFLACLSNKN